MMEKWRSCNVSTNDRMCLECQSKVNISMMQKRQACNALTSKGLYLEHQSKEYAAETTGL